MRRVDPGLHWANLGILFTTALLPFPTAVISSAMRVGNLADEQTAIALYALIGILLCASWVVFFWYLHRHRELTKEHVGESFFARESARVGRGAPLAIVCLGLATPTSRWPFASSFDLLRRASSARWPARTGAGHGSVERRRSTC